jgi:hypothetical protein
MTTDIDYMALGLDGNVLRLGIWTQGITKNMGTPGKKKLDALTFSL